MPAPRTNDERERTPNFADFLDVTTRAVMRDGFTVYSTLVFN